MLLVPLLFLEDSLDITSCVVVCRLLFNYGDITMNNKAQEFIDNQQDFKFYLTDRPEDYIELSYKGINGYEPTWDIHYATVESYKIFKGYFTWVHEIFGYGEEIWHLDSLKWDNKCVVQKLN